jgi:hypothetical protein
VPRYKYSDEALRSAAAEARNVTEVLRILGIRVSGGAHAHISRRLKAAGVDTSHFTGSAHSRGQRARRRTSPRLLVDLPAGSRRVPGWRLKRALTMLGVPERCEGCGIGDRWQGAPLTLHVDHIDGNFLDNRPHNVRLLCPNCHSQTSTYAGSRRGPAVVPDVVYDPHAVTPTGMPIGRRLPRPPQWSWRMRVYDVRGP